MPKPIPLERRAHYDGQLSALDNLFSQFLAADLQTTLRAAEELVPYVASAQAHAAKQRQMTRFVGKPPTAGGREAPQ
jgi:hypothetical protein